MKIGILQNCAGQLTCVFDKNLTDVTACVAIADQLFPKRWVSKNDVEMNDKLLSQVNTAISGMNFDQAVDYVRNLYVKNIG